MRIHANGIAYLSHPYQSVKGDWTVAAAKNKIEFIAAARCIGILLVVFGHSYPFDVYISPSLWKIKDFIYTFHMPLACVKIVSLIDKRISMKWVKLAIGM